MGSSVNAERMERNAINMKRFQKGVSFLLCACMLLGVSAFAEGTAAQPENTQAIEVTEAVASTAAELQDDTLLATVNGEEIKWSDIKAEYDEVVGEMGGYYDLTDLAIATQFRAIALQSWIIKAVLPMQQLKPLGLEPTAEETASLTTEAENIWKEAQDRYISENAELTETSTEEEKAKAQADADAYFLEMGYTRDSYIAKYVLVNTVGRVSTFVTQDITVTDADVEAEYQAKVTADKERFENDFAAFMEYNNSVDQMDQIAMMYGQPNTMEHSWYKPAGFRAVKHILLPVDEALMGRYNDLQSRLEEQMNAEAVAAEETPTEEAAATDAEATAAPDATPDPTEEPVTQADVDAAKADILASLADKIDEINQKIADGVPFEELITAYGVTADGQPSDPGMTVEPYKTSGYEVAAESKNYVGPFVEAAFSINNIGDVSAPYLTSYGVHIVKYIGDVAAGPVVMTADQRQARREALELEKKEDAYYAKVEEWQKAAKIEYTGVIPSMEELEKLAEEAAAEEAAAEVTAVPEEAVPESEPTAAPAQ